MFFEVNIKGDIEPKATENVNINIDDATYRTKGTINTYKINGKTVGVLSCWFNVSAPEENRLNQLRDAIVQLASYDIAIICADTNANNQNEFETMLGIIGNAGYVSANGGYFGSFETYNLESSSYKQIDNIFVRGAKIKNVICPDVYDKLCSDHYPVIADIMIN
jgi:endonuclease/exonuclease/phosphatase family metal-dependent hydrolase